MFRRHHASNRNTSRQKNFQNNTTVISRAIQRCLVSVGPHWNLQGRRIATCAHARSGSSNSSVVITAVAADTHELTCETSSAVQNLLLVRVVNGQQRRNRPHEQCVEQQQPQQSPQHHLGLLEEQLRTQPSFIQPTSSPAQQQQQCADQQHQQHDGQRQHSAHGLQQQQQQNLQYVKQQWQNPHVTVDSHQQIGLLEPLQTGNAAQQYQHPQRQKQQQQVPERFWPEQHTSPGFWHGSSSGAGSSASDSYSVPNECAASSSAASRAARTRRKHGRQLGVYNTHGWNRQEVLQGWKLSVADNVARTPLGFAMVRTSSGSQPRSLAKQLQRWLQCEQHAVLSAAGAGRTLTALQAVTELWKQLEQLQLQQQLQVTPHVRSCNRPEGGRCLVYTLHCQLLPVGSEQQQDAAAAAMFEQQHPGVDAHGFDDKALQQQAHCCSNQPQQLQGCTSQQVAHHQFTAAAKWQPDMTKLQLQEQQHYQHMLYSKPQQMQLVPSQQHGNSPPAAAGMGAGQLHSMQLPTHQLDPLSLGQQPQQQVQHHINGSCTGGQHGLHVKLQLQQQQQQQQPVVVYSQSQQQTCQQAGWERMVPPSRQQHHLDCDQQGMAQRVQANTAAGVRELEARGSSMALADELGQALLESAAVCVPVAYDKQAAKLLEAAALLQSRWQQPLQQQQQRGSRKLDLSSRHDSSSSCSSGVSGSSLQVVLQPCYGWVQRQSGMRTGVHVYVFAVPYVHY